MQGPTSTFYFPVSVILKKLLWFLYSTVLLCPTFIYPVAQSSPRLSPDLLESLNRVRFKEVTSEIIFYLRKYSLTGQIFTLGSELGYEGHLDSQKIQDSFIPTVVFGKRQYGQSPGRVARRINATIATTRHNIPNNVHIRAFELQASSNKGRLTRKRRTQVPQFNPQWKTVYSLAVGQSEFSTLPDRLRFMDYFINFGMKTNKFDDFDSRRSFEGGARRRDLRHAVPPSHKLFYTPNNVIKIQTEIQYKTSAQSLQISLPHQDCQIVQRREDDFEDSNNYSNPQNVPSPFKGGPYIGSSQSATGRELNGSTVLLVPEPRPQLMENSSKALYNCQNNNTFLDTTTIQNSIVIIVYISCGAFCITESNINFLNFVTAADEEEPCRALKGSENSRLSPTACILHEVAVKLSVKMKNGPVVFFPGMMESDSDWSSNPHSGTVEIFKRNIDLKVASSNLGRGGMFYNSLVFLAKKRFYSWDNSLRPLSLLGWLIIAIVCGAVAIVFALIKVVTMSNVDQPWYDYVVQQMLDIMREERTGKRNKLLSMRSGSEEAEGHVGGESPGPNSNNSSSSSSSSRDSSSDGGGSSSRSGNGATSVEERGKTSKAMLHGTIRIVSFVMVAIYEGKLYNTMTFPKARFVSTFDELLTSDKYAVKLSREVADVNFLLGSKNLTVLNRFSESFNIEDCINWVEHSASHGCVAYDFEFRNLPKTHKMKVLNEETIFAKSKTSILNSLRRRPSPVITTALLHPAAQLSRWILEAGIFQFWMVAENFFMENLVPSKMTKRKVFSIKDYVSLFFIYVSLLVLACFVFVSEVILYWCRKRFVRKSIVGALVYMWKIIKQCGLRLWGLWLVTKRFFVARQKCCIRMKRIINNMV